MNRIDRSIWNDRTGTFIAASEDARGSGKKSAPGARAAARGARFPLKGLAVSLLLAFGSNVYAAPIGGAVSAGSASIAGSAGKTTINQGSQNVAINWQSFSIGQGETVRFVQPNGSSIALNRVLGSDASSILGSLSANGKVFLLNPNGILFGKGAQVNVGGLIASTLSITDSDFMAGKYRFAGASNAAILNQGSINADGGYVALLGANVSNQGIISAKLGTVTLAAGKAMTLDVAGDGLLNVTVNEGAVNALAQNGGLIQANGGLVLLTAQAAGNLLQSAVNNTGVIQAQTVENRNGTIRLMAGMQSGSVNVGGTLDASAPSGGNGGFIETSAATVNVANDAKVTTAAPMGVTGTWLIDPQDFTIGSAPGNNITGATLSALLVTNSVVISTDIGTDAVVAGTPPVSSRFSPTPGVGDINVNAAVTWTAAPSTTTLTLNAARDVNVNQAVTATNGNFVVCCGRDINVNAAIATTNGSVLLSAGHDVNIVKSTLNPLAAMTTTDGNMNICAGHDINVNLAPITLTRGSAIPAQSLASLGVALGLLLNAGTASTGPDVAGGTVIIAPGTPPLTVTGPNAPATINYNPIAYTTPVNYLPNFVLTSGATLTQHMLVFPGGADKTVDGTTAATFTSLQGNPAGVTLGSGGTATFDTPDVGVDKTITYSGFSLAGASAGNFALPVACCGPAARTTTGTILAAAPVVPPVVVVPPVTPPVVPPDVPPIVPPVVFVPPALADETLPTVPQIQFAPETLPVQHKTNLTVEGTGVRMPPVVLAAVPPPIPPAPVVVPPPAPPAVVVPPVAPPPIYVPPERPRKPDRN